MRSIISHPGKPLVDHLRSVATHCRAIIESGYYQLEMDKSIIADLVYIQGAVHDLGKATENFQTYIQSEGKTVIRPKHHALISAYLARHIAMVYLEKCELSKEDRFFLPYFVFTAVKRHHGRVKNFDNELLSNDVPKKRRDLEILVDNFYHAEVQEMLDELLGEMSLSYQWSSFRSYMKDLDDVMAELMEDGADVADVLSNLDSLQKARYFYLHQLMASTLLFADKTDVKLGSNRVAKNLGFDQEAVRKYRTTCGFDQAATGTDQRKVEINKRRNQAYLESLEHFKENFSPDQCLYSITLPTGLGKTITSLALAMEMKRMLGEQNPRIVVAIPFTSIIDQNYEVFQKIFDNPTSDLLLKHHHLAEPVYKMEEDAVLEKTEEASHFLIETWQSEVVVTTFVQLLEGLLTNDKGKLLKFPQLCQSIIVIDEIQQIKYELWELIRRVFVAMGKQFNCYFILMSATQPMIFDPKSEIRELIPRHEQYFRLFQRTRLINCTDKALDMAAFSQTVVNYHQANPTKDILVILNTIGYTRQCFEALKASIAKEQAHLYFLATCLTPFERKRIIGLIGEEDGEIPRIIVSTQLIEAGVDISVDTVFRALAPLDSIIQAAGRANRAGEKQDISNVYLYKIEELERATKSIYGAILLEKTEQILKGLDVIEESDYLSLINAYFAKLQEQSAQRVSPELRDLECLNFEDLGRFRFIPYRETVSLFVQLNEEAEELWTAYLRIRQNTTDSLFDKKEKFAQIKAAFYDYVVNVPIYSGETGYSIFGQEPQHHFHLWDVKNPLPFYRYDSKDDRHNTGFRRLEEQDFFI